jgi:hypothetical protein
LFDDWDAVVREEDSQWSPEALAGAPRGSCATAVIVHSMYRLVYGDIAEGKKLVDFGEIFS